MDLKPKRLRRRFILIVLGDLTFTCATMRGDATPMCTEGLLPRLGSFSNAGKVGQKTWGGFSKR